MASLENLIDDLDLIGNCLLFHASFRRLSSSGINPMGFIKAFLDKGDTVMVPTFSWCKYAIPPPSDQRPARNGWNYSVDHVEGKTPEFIVWDMGDPTREIYTPRSDYVDWTMGVLPKSVLSIPGRIRGNHPLNSFTAAGPGAHDLISGQAPLDVYAPIRELANQDGVIVLIDTGLTSATAIHYSEQLAGRQSFRRWANDQSGNPMQVQVGGDSDGFECLSPFVHHLERKRSLGGSTWRTYPAAGFCDTIAEAIKKDPYITHCGGAGCETCNDAVKGGPIV